jgi:hypothetical protein
MDDRMTETDHPRRPRATRGAKWAWAIFSIVVALTLVYWFARRGQATTNALSGDAAAHGNVAPISP